MAKTTLTFEIGGQIELEALANGLREFHRLIAALTPRTPKIKWIVEDLSASSAVATLRGEAENEADVEKVVEDYNDIGRALSQDQQPSERFAQNVITVVNAIKKRTRSVEYIRFETPFDDYTILSPNGTKPTTSSPHVSIGTVTGMIQTITNRSDLKFNIFDSVHDRPVSCYLEPGQEEKARQAWGRYASVVGTVSRNSLTGIATSIREIISIDVSEEFESDPSFEARGSIPWQTGFRLPEDIIRELRDA